MPQLYPDSMRSLQLILARQWTDRQIYFPSKGWLPPPKRFTAQNWRGCGNKNEMRGAQKQKHYLETLHQELKGSSGPLLSSSSTGAEICLESTPHLSKGIVTPG